MPEMIISNRKIGSSHEPLIIAEVGINHDGKFDKAVQMVDDAAAVGCECVKFQTHIIEDEMVPNNVFPPNAEDTIWDIMNRCALTAKEEEELKRYVESKEMIFLSTPFSRAAANRLEKIGVAAFKIGSGECNNYPLVEHIARFKKPVILSTGMNNIGSISKSVNILRKHKIPFALLHCTSMYPTPYDKVRLGAMKELRKAFPDAVLGLSDHTKTNHTCFGAVALGASILERHFASDKRWRGPDIEISMNPNELRDLIEGSRAVYRALRGGKEVLIEEKPTIEFAYASVVAIRDISAGEILSEENIWVKRPGTGEIRAEYFGTLLGKTAKVNVKKNDQLRWNWVED